MSQFDKIKESAERIREIMEMTATEEEVKLLQQVADASKFKIPMTTTTVSDTYKLQVKFANKSTNPNPEYATTGSSGFDLRADLSEPLTLKVGYRALVPTGLYFQLPDNFEIQVRPRSGLAVKHGITVLNSPGTVDADYRGEVKVILINHGEEDFIINHGDRIAQAVVANVSAKNILSLLQVDDISVDTERGAGGFNSTGIK